MGMLVPSRLAESLNRLCRYSSNKMSDEPFCENVLHALETIGFGFNSESTSLSMSNATSSLDPTSGCAVVPSSVAGTAVVVRRRFNDSPDGAAKTLGKTLGPTVTTTASTVTNEQKKLARISFDGLLNTHLTEVDESAARLCDRPTTGDWYYYYTSYSTVMYHLSVYLSAVR